MKIVPRTCFQANTWTNSRHSLKKFCHMVDMELSSVPAANFVAGFSYCLLNRIKKSNMVRTMMSSTRLLTRRCSGCNRSRCLLCRSLETSSVHLLFIFSHISSWCRTPFIFAKTERTRWKTWSLWISAGEVSFLSRHPS